LLKFCIEKLVFGIACKLSHHGPSTVGNRSIAFNGRSH